MTDIEGKIAVVTGGASGIGRGIAEALAEGGATVVIADVEPAKAQTTADELPGANGSGAAYAVDVSDRASVLALAAVVEERFGRVDILVNNAGVASMAPLEEMSLDDWNWLLGVNFFGVVNGVAAFLPLLRRNPGGGHIVNTGSMAGFAAQPGLGAYGTTKFAVTAFTEVLARELADTGIRVSLLAPGPVLTNLGSASRNRPAGHDAHLVDNDLSLGDGQGWEWIEPRDVGAIVARAIRNEDLYAITHPSLWPGIEERVAGIHAAFTKYSG